MEAKEYLEIALGGNYNISTLTLSAWEGMLESYAKIKIKESGQPEMLKHLTFLIEAVEHEYIIVKENIDNDGQESLFCKLYTEMIATVKKATS